MADRPWDEAQRRYLELEHELLQHPDSLPSQRSARMQALSREIEWQRCLLQGQVDVARDLWMQGLAAGLVGAAAMLLAWMIAAVVGSA